MNALTCGLEVVSIHILRNSCYTTTHRCELQSPCLTKKEKPSKVYAVVVCVLLCSSRPSFVVCFFILFAVLLLPVISRRQAFSFSFSTHGSWNRFCISLSSPHSSSAAVNVDTDFRPSTAFTPVNMKYTHFHFPFVELYLCVLCSDLCAHSGDGTLDYGGLWNTNHYQWSCTAHCSLLTVYACFWILSRLAIF